MDFLVKTVAFYENKIPDIPGLSEKSANIGYAAQSCI
jgi:hypothetical protein